MIKQFGSGNLLDCIGSGSILDPIVEKEKFNRARCDRCGCWISTNTAIVNDKWIYCGVCDHSRASPMA